jgi:hypothetical protein
VTTVAVAAIDDEFDAVCVGDDPHEPIVVTVHAPPQDECIHIQFSPTGSDGKYRSRPRSSQEEMPMNFWSR